jgi:gamma-F420-2:alpha-L-glutamate ligase
MDAWLVYFKENAEYNKQYINLYIEEGNKLGIHVRLILVEDLEFGVVNGTLFIKYKGNIPNRPDFVIFRAIYPLLNKHLELLGMKVFNNSFVSEICNDKAKTYQYLAKTGIQMVDSSFYLNNQVRGCLDQIKNTSVMKAVDGHGGSQVFLVEPQNIGNYSKVFTTHENDKWNEIIQGIHHSDIVLQPFTGNRHQDLRVYVIGKQIIAAVLRTAKEGFRSNFSLGGEISLYFLSDDEKRLIKKITDQFEFGLVGIDFIIGDTGELIFNEIEDVVGARMLFQCSDINIVRLYLEYIINTLN